MTVAMAQLLYCRGVACIRTAMKSRIRASSVSFGCLSLLRNASRLETITSSAVDRMARVLTTHAHELSFQINMRSILTEHGILLSYTVHTLRT